MTDQGTPSPVAPAVPAGWHVNPATGQRQWWTGVDWAPLPPPKPTPQPLAVFSLVGGGIAFLLGLVPVLGILLALGAGVLAVLALIKKATPRWMPLVGAGAAAIALITSLIVIGSLVAGVGGAAPVAETSPTATTEPKPTPTPEPTPIAVPDVVGMTTADAIAALITAGFDTATEGDQGIVASQDPAGGTTALPDSTVTITSKIDLSKFTKMSTRDYAQMAKDPDAFIGRNIILVGVVTQFDSATGPCTMRANTGPAKTAYSYEYDVNTIITSGDGESDCPILDPLVTDDHFSMRATVLGAFEYDTAIGGSATAVLMEAFWVKIQPKQEF